MAENNEKTVEETVDAENQAEATEIDTVAEEKAAVEEEKSSKPDKKKVKKLEAELEKKEAEIAEANDKYTRLFAEYDNFRKRTAKEKEGIYADAYIDALSQILPVLDNLERAAAYKDSDAETLEKMGVKEIEAEGKTFDPNVHNAVMHIDDESFGENEVVEVFAKGYARGDKVLRHSMVKVAN